jgi:hypothetical protein
VVTGVLAEIDNAYAAMNAYISNTVSTNDIKIDVVFWSGGKCIVSQNLGTYPWDDVWYNPSGAGEVLPPGDSALLKLMTTLGKHYGRKFIGGLTETAQNSGILVAGCVEDLADMATSFLSEFTISAGNYLVPVINSTLFQEALPVIEAAASAVIAYQRRRRPGTGS